MQSKCCACDYGVKVILGKDLSPEIGESVILLRCLSNDTILLDIITVLGFVDIFP